ncbi:MAG: D-sedoheptulose-7-phosphate isomerase [Rhodanobacteraceae bacterium]
MTVQQVFAEHAAVMQDAAATLPSGLEEVTTVLQTCLENRHKILACGNGGSAAAAQHLVAELVVRFCNDRRALAAIALSADTMTLTAIGNDYGYERIFARQVEAIASPGDVLVAISTSGNSANVIEAAKTAQTIGCRVIALTGSDGGEIASHADLVVRAPSSVVARIQEVHDVCIHAIAEALEENVRRASPS